MITGEDITIEKKRAVGVITFNKAQVLNVMDTKMLLELGESISQMEKDETIRAVIMTGGNNFCAGADIRELKAKDPEKAEVFSRLGHTICNQLEHIGKPVIAAVGGYALGGGCEIALACDMRIAGENAKFGQPEITLGLIPGFGATRRLPELVGMAKAKEMILTGRMINAKEAESIGLVNRVVRDEELMEKAAEIALAITQKSPFAIKTAKRLLNDNQNRGRGLESEIVFFSECFATEDHLEGINAFLEKRTPRFRGI
ncbi:MAG: enoyl-CoA hydratase-related protein [Thermodesulfovibrionales bacterium]|jgi:enoyl-CoA hydratase